MKGNFQPKARNNIYRKKSKKILPKGKIKFDFGLFYFCAIGKNPNFGKVRNFCLPIQCEYLEMKSRNRSYGNHNTNQLVQITNKES